MRITPLRPPYLATRPAFARYCTAQPAGHSAHLVAPYASSVPHIPYRPRSTIHWLSTAHCTASQVRVPDMGQRAQGLRPTWRAPSKSHQTFKGSFVSLSFRGAVREKNRRKKRKKEKRKKKKGKRKGRT
eukprot:524456-Rhodomonas_salina.1